MNSCFLRFSCLVFLCCNFLTAQTTAIPDAFFENYLETHDADGASVNIGDASSLGDGIANNGLVLTSNIDVLTLLNVDGLGIENLSGIEYFTALETLICSNNNLTTIDVSNNTNLASLLCGSNFLQNISVVNNINLESLNCSDNLLQDIDLSNNVILESLTISNNQLLQIDVSNNTNLNLLSVSNNRISGILDVSNNLQLEGLFCSSNQISTLDLTANTLLKNLDASNNQLTVLDLTNVNSDICPDPQTDPITPCQGLSTINVSRNNLISLNVANGYNDLILVLEAIDNPDLFCIQIDENFTPNGWIKDDFVYYSDTLCVDIFTYVPDDNFEQALINQNLDDVLDNFVLTSNIETLTNLDVSSSNISSLEGIEDFTALEMLNVNDNSIENVDISNNQNLLQLNISNNNLTEIDVNANTDLTVLDCSSNQISILNLENNTFLTDLNASNNAFLEINLNTNLALSDINISFNQIESLDVSSNPNITNLICNDNSLFFLDVSNGNNTTILNFNATNNPDLSCIKVDDVANANAAAGWQKDAMATYNTDCGTYIPDDNFELALINQGIDSDGTLNNFVPTADINVLTVLNIPNLMVEDLTGIQDFVALQNFNCSGNLISILNLENNVAITTVNVSNNQIEAIDVSTLTNLTTLNCNSNALQILNIKNGNNTNLAMFNGQNNPNLFCISVDDATIGNIPPAWQKDAMADYNADCQNNRFTAIPDQAFEQALINLGFDAAIDGQVLTRNIELLQTLDVSDAGISDLTGIKDFKSLVELDCSGNFLEALDLSDMTFLERLNSSSNFINNNILNLNGSTNLKELFCANNDLENLDISTNINLEIIDAADNKLSVLNIDSNTVLLDLNISNNELSTLDISNNSLLQKVNCNSNFLNTITTSALANTTLTELSCANNNLSNITINNYQALQNFNARSNELNQIDLNGNAALEILTLTNNALTSLDVTNNVNLVELSAAQNTVANLNVSSNSFLELLNLNFNELNNIDLSQNAALKFFYSGNNQLTNLDVSSNTSLIELDCNTNQLSSLILSNNLGSLKTLNVSNNQIEGDLDLTTMAISSCVFQTNQTQFCPENISINISNNLFESVNLQNGINAEISNFNTINNPNLDCIQIDNINTIGVSWIKDDFAEYSEDCNYGETFVPDDNFEQALINLGLDNAPLDDYVLTANIEGLTTLDVNGNTIADLTGIEDFTALEELNVANNNLSEIDVNSNLNLINLNVSNNQLTAVITTDNTLLESLICTDNLIESLDLTQNTNLSTLDISNNAFTSFLPIEIPSLSNFICDGNLIMELDFQLNSNLTNLSCQSNVLEVLNVKNGQNDILLNLNSQNNPNLECIETDNGIIPAGATWQTDTTTQLSTECFFGETFVPDDNFEQALIDMGFDTAPLNDYVLTQNIENLTFLDISNKEIIDLTGIEDFTALTNLNFEGNTVNALDLSNNLLLTNLNASSNLLQTIDLSSLFELRDLNLSNNEITSINLSNNLALTDVDLGNNLLTELNVDALINLSQLDCNNNLLSRLSVTQNTNLTLLLCQSNNFIDDQLNLQNGNNQNLQIFNAINNPDLGCILVDNPVTVIENTDGTYDNWNKDNSATYQIICDDADNDGVPNVDDLCPGTEFGVPVDLFGCPFPGLANDNFAISILSETCLNSNDGQISISSQQLYTYKITLVSDDFFQEYNFTNDIDIFNLLAGTYEMCITIGEWPDYEVCYTIVITEPDPLEVFASRIASSSRIQLELSGSTSYNVVFNGNSFTTHNPDLILDLENGINTLKVFTDKNCQGIFEKTFYNSEAFILSPNPFNNVIKINNLFEGEDVTLKLFSIEGKLVLDKNFIAEAQSRNIDTSNLKSGLYLISIQSKTRMSTYKIIKK